MAIEYLEIRDGSLSVVGIVDTAQSVIWHSVFFGVGDFEIYIHATPENVSLLRAGYYVTRPDDLEVGIIEAISITDDAQEGLMLTASGRFAKSILDRRIIYDLSRTMNHPWYLTGNVEAAVRQLVELNAISCPFDSSRNIPELALGALAGLPHKIVDENGNDAVVQAPCESLLTHTDALLEEYGLASTVILDEDAGKLLYVIFAGVDRSVGNEAGNDPVIFSKSFDNLTSSNYHFDAATERNAALVGGAGEGLERFHTVVTGTHTGLQRRETWVDASSINRDYEDDSGEQQTYSEAEYRALLTAAGRLTLAGNVATETFDGAIDIANCQHKYNEDFALGDIVTTQNDEIGVFVNVRLREVIEVQDENGYSIEANNQT